MATESFFSNASLAYLASAGAGKDGKTYSIKPTDGTGDFTFSRGSNLTATRVGPDGLIEKGRENLFVQSNNFTTSWTSSNLTLSSGEAGYDGTNDAWKFLPSGAPLTHFLYQNVTGGGIVTFSVYAKAAGYPGLFVYSDQSFAGKYFNVQNGTLGDDYGSPIDSSITAVGNGWYRCSVTVSHTSGNFNIFVSPDGVNTYGMTADGVSAVLVQDAQMEQGLAATDYIESGATTGKAGLLENEPRFDYSGGATCPSLLLEPSRTNLVGQSEYFGGLPNSNCTIDINDTTSPEGLTNASKVIGSGTDVFIRTRQAVSAPSAGDYIFSVFAKKGNVTKIEVRALTYGGATGITEAQFDLNAGTAITSGAFIEDYGNGWYKCSTPVTLDAGDLSGSLSIYAIQPSGSIIYDNNAQTSGQYFYTWGWQVEDGSYPTSYIPNHSGGSVTRGTDTTSSNTAVAGATQWTWFFDNTGTETDSEVKIVFQLLGATTALRYYTTNNGRFFASGYFGESDAIGKLCVKWDGSTLTMFKNGTKSTSTSSTDIGAITGIGSFMSSGGIGAPVDLHQMLFFDTALSDADCITLTT